MCERAQPSSRQMPVLEKHPGWGTNLGRYGGLELNHHGYGLVSIQGLPGDCNLGQATAMASISHPLVTVDALGAITVVIKVITVVTLQSIT